MREVIFYGTGKYAEEHFKVLKEQYAPICFTGANAEKWGKTYLGLPVISPQEARAQYPDAEYYVSISDDAWPFGKRLEAIDDLIQKYGVDKDRIINYQDYFYGRNCPYASHRIILQDDKLQNCCENWADHNVPFSDYFSEEGETVEALLEMKRKIIRYVGNAADKEQTPYAKTYYEKIDGQYRYTPYAREKMQRLHCGICREPLEGYWPKDSFKFNYLQVSSNSDCRCNLGCKYCCEGMPGYKPGPLIADKIAGAITAIYEAGLFSEHLMFCLANGEPSIYPELDKLIDALPSAYYQILTNAVVYSKTIENAIAKSGEIVVSVDSGTAESYAKVKGRNCFEDVKRNLFKYREHGSVVMKYIIMPGYNDSERDVDEFIRLCEQVNPLRVEIVRDWLSDGFDYDRFQYTPATMAVVARMVKKFDETALNVGYTVFPNDFRTALRQYEPSL